MNDTQNTAETNETMDWSNTQIQITEALKKATDNGATENDIERIRAQEFSYTDRVTNQEEGTWTHVARNIRRYKTIINVKDITGNSLGAKIKKVQNAVNNIEEYMGSRMHFYGKDQFIMVEFGTKEKAEQACERQIEENNEIKLHLLRNKGDTEVRNRMMVVRDLP